MVTISIVPSLELYVHTAAIVSLRCFFGQRQLSKRRGVDPELYPVDIFPYKRDSHNIDPYYLIWINIWPTERCKIVSGSFFIK